MIAPAMAPVETALLSSNWKILQARLKATAAADTESKKRKRPNEVDSKPSAKKRTKVNDRNGKSKASMNSHTGGKWTLKHSKSAPSLKPKAKTEQPKEDEQLDRPSSSNQDVRPSLLPEALINEGVSQNAIAGKYISLDCEMVGYGPNPESDSQLARVSIINYHGDQIYDSLVLPQVPVTDYRTPITGITAKSLKAGRPFKEVQKDVATFLSGRVLVGHALKKDLDVLILTHPRKDIRDTSRHAPYRALAGGKTPALRKLVKELLGLEIQTGVHSSVEDARAAMLLYRREKDAFELDHLGRFGKAKLLEGAHGVAGDTTGGSKSKLKKGKR